MEHNAPRDRSNEIAYPVKGWIAKLKYGLKLAKRWQDQSKGGTNESDLGRGQGPVNDKTMR
jgi:hypothetical protein